MTTPMKRPIFKLLVAATAVSLAAFSAPAYAQADTVLDAARSAGQVGEQADGYLGIPSGSSTTADIRARMEQINIRRRAAYTQRAQERGVTVNEMAAAVACEIFSRRIAVGEKYRDEAGAWRQRTAAAPVVRPSFCPS